jgi:hypothetical protein
VRDSKPPLFGSQSGALHLLGRNETIGRFSFVLP